MTTLHDIIDAHVSEVFLNKDHFAECVVVHASSGDRNMTVLVEIDDPIRDESGFSPALYTGQLRIPFKSRAQFTAQSDTTLTVTARGFVWHVVDVGEDDFGFCNVGIRRETAEHSNAIDLQGVQHRY